MTSDTSGLTLEELAAALQGTLEGDPQLRVRGAAGLEDAEPGTIVRVEASRYLASALSGPAAALLVPPDLGPVDKPCIRVPNVRLAFVRCLELFAREVFPPPGIHPTALVGEQVEIGEGCSIGPYALVGDRARLGPGVVLHAHAVVGEECEIGAGSVLFPHVVLYPYTLLGERVRIHAGAVVGSDGFGYEWTGQKHLKKPHNGRVRIGSDVEIGANTTIDRGTTGETVIGDGTKIDNLVQIAHNVRTGAHCLIIAQVGIAGSTTVGNGVVLAGQAGIPDHVTIGDGAVIAAQAGLWGSVPAGQTYGGYPARPRSEERRIQAALGRLPELLNRVRELEKRLEESSPRRHGDTESGTERDEGEKEGE